LDVDFLTVFEAGVKDLFPQKKLVGCVSPNFENMVQEVYDSSWDEQRYGSHRWEVLGRWITGRISQKKVRESVDKARSEAVQKWQKAARGTWTPEKFITEWAGQTVWYLGKATGWSHLVSVLPESKAVDFFDDLVSKNGVPQPILQKHVQQYGPIKRGWRPILEAVRQAYFNCGFNIGEADEDAYWEKGRGQSYGSSYTQRWESNSKSWGSSPSWDAKDDRRSRVYDYESWEKDAEPPVDECDENHADDRPETAHPSRSPSRERYENDQPNDDDGPPCSDENWDQDADIPHYCPPDNTQKDRWHWSRSRSRSRDARSREGHQRQQGQRSESRPKSGGFGYREECTDTEDEQHADASGPSPRIGLRGSLRPRS